VGEVKHLWWNKSRRAQTNEDYETWVEGGVVPTLNAFDNGDTRATTIIFYGNRVADIRLQDDKINTLQARMGTGGNNMPMVATTQVRRLTPLECERLQGFPDGWNLSLDRFLPFSPVIIKRVLLPFQQGSLLFSNPIL